ncbi:MAG: hypothetical protein BIFFINMI_02524 [Phycisphaerae bacterium]|nr:hypothetical protein [Phycisphaerae bacterium]
MIRSAALQIAALCLAALSAARADVIAPRVTTDRSVDTYSLPGIVRDVIAQADAKTDEQKAIALYEYVRRVIFHYEQRGEKRDQVYDLDALRQINTYGYSFCTQQMLVLTHLWNTAGIEGKYWSVPGHSTAQAFYGGTLHWFDPLIGAYVYSRDKTNGIASLQEIAKDPTVLTKAAEEGRASPTFMPCGKVLYEDAARLSGSAEYAAFCKGFGDDVGYMAANAAKAKKGGGPRRSLYSPDMTLRPGETVTYLWDCLPGEFNVKADAPKDQLPPNHFCGVEADSRDKVNWPYWRNYVKEINGVKTARYYANGTQTFRPAFNNEHFKQGVESNSFAWFGWSGAGAPSLRPAAVGQAADIVYKMSTPYVYTSGTLSAEFHRAADADVSRLYVSADAGAHWTKVWDAAEEKAGAGVVKATANIGPHVHGLHEFWVRAECSTDATRTVKDKEGKEKIEMVPAGLQSMAVTAVFQHNMYARPQLMAGDNKVTVTAANPAVLEFQNFHVKYVWEESAADGGPAVEKTSDERVTSSPQTWTIPVAGEAMPKMKSLTLSVTP